VKEEFNPEHEAEVGRFVAKETIPELRVDGW
jgi:hypothetical protein